MFRSLLIGFCITSTMLAFSACSDDSPSSPSGLTAPTIQSPADGETIQTLRPTLSVGAATGGTGVPTYRFEIARDSNFGAMVAAEEGIAPEASGSASWRVPVALEGGETYFWRARASASGEASPYSQVASFTTVGGFSRNQAAADDLLVYDPLTVGSTIGEFRGGTFTNRGWMATAPGNFIRYQVPTLRNGFVEFDVTNLRNPNPVSEKRNLLIMWDPTAGDYTQNPYRVHIAKYDDRLVSRWQLRFRFISQGQETNTGINYTNWDPSQIYTWRLEWGAFPQIVESQRARVLLDGQEIMVRNYDPIYNPSTHWIELGMGPRNETLERAIWSNVKIGVRRP